MAVVCAMMALGLLWGKEGATFLGPVRNGLSDQPMVTLGSRAIAARPRSAMASSTPRLGAIGGGAGGQATYVFWAFALFAGACSVRRVAASRVVSQHKFRSCTVACRAAELPMPGMFQPRTPVVEELKLTPATTAPPTTKAHIAEPRTAACCAKMVRGVRRATTRSAARRGKQHKTADRTAASRAARRAVGSRLQAASCLGEVPPLTFDASRQRMKIQAGLRLANRVRSGRLNEIRLPAGSAGKLNGRFSAVLYVIRDFTESKNLTCATVRVVASDLATEWPAPMHC